MTKKKSSHKPKADKSWDKMIKRYHFVKEVAKDLASGIKSFGPTIAYVGTFGGAAFKGFMRFFGWDYPSVPTIGLNTPTPPAKYSLPNEDASDMAGGEGIGLGRADTIGHGVVRRRTSPETTEDQEDVVVIPKQKHDYLMAQTTVPSYAEKDSSYWELGLYYANHVFWVLCIIATLVYLARHIKIKFIREKENELQ